jgi:GNAT superfamily N-acetyltransferase
VSIRTEVVDVDVVRPLQRAVLRPGLPPEAASYPEDELPDTLHVAAYDDAGRVAGVATYFPQVYPGPFSDDSGSLTPAEATAAWRLRGMASDPERRGAGFGAAVLARGLAEIRERGGRWLWCNARTSAVPFYERHGLTVVGAEFEVPHIGPHFRMLTRL